MLASYLFRYFEAMTPEEGSWISLFAAIAGLTQLTKFVLLYFLLWRSRHWERRGPLQFLAFLFLMSILVLLPYQDQKASKSINRILMVATVLQYVSWIGLAYIIWFKH